VVAEAVDLPPRVVVAAVVVALASQLQVTVTVLVAPPVAQTGQQEE
jgi:hypothetical protein